MKPFDFLYYPYINFRNEEWLKLVALYGDSVSRIVPVHYPTRTSDTITALTENKFIRNISPAAAGDAPAKMFRDFLVQYSDLLQPEYAVDRTQPWGSDPDDRHLEDQEVTRRAYVEASKLGGIEINELEKTQLVIKGRDGDINWIGMHPRLANLYMTLLANAVANTKPLRLTADFASDHVNVHASSVEDIGKVLLPDAFKAEELLAGGGPSVPSAFATFVFEQIVPDGLADTPIEKILKLRNDHYEDLVKYQAAIEAFVTDHAYLADIDDVDELQAHLQKEFKGRIEPALKKLKDGLWLAKVKFWSGVVALSFTPPAVLALGPLAAAPLITGAVAGAVGLLNMTAKTRGDVEGVLDGNQYSWLHHIKRDLQPTTVVNEILSKAQSFVYSH
jgi:hypothetical protein